MRGLQFFIYSLLVMAVFFAAQPGEALPVSSPPRYPLATAFFRPFVKTLDTPVYIYNWARGAVSPAFLSSSISAKDPRAIAWVAARSRWYWDLAGNDRVDTYGMALYAAVDPVFTRDYGGHDQDWILTAIQLPVGFRFLNLAKDKDIRIPPNVSGELTAAGCPARWTTESFFDQLFANQADANKSCREAIRDIFENELQIDGFAYEYGSSTFSECANSRQVGGPTPYPDRQNSFVISSDRIIRSKTVSVYNQLSTDQIEDRARILSLFYKAGHDLLEYYVEHPRTKPEFYDYQKFFYAWVSEHYPGQVGDTMNGSPAECKKGECVLPTVCTQPPLRMYSCRPLKAWPTFPVMKYPSILDAKNEDPQVVTFFTFLWPNLDHHPAITHLNSWVKNNLFGCSDKPQYH